METKASIHWGTRLDQRQELNNFDITFSNVTGKTIANLKDSLLDSPKGSRLRDLGDALQVLFEFGGCVNAKNVMPPLPRHKKSPGRRRK